MTSREKFEDKYALLMGKTIASIRDCRHESGYREREGYTMEIAWRMWQASRAAVEIELPEAESIGCTTGYYAADVVEAIESAGLKVKK
ncbi:MAG: hypothetical protein E7L15_17510 [Citrobacter portucalensis]|nr:hypothetical protein [Citrobacter portucalensis]